jgi:hypothetical protein
LAALRPKLSGGVVALVAATISLAFMAPCKKIAYRTYLKGAFSFLVTQGALFFTLTGKYDFRFSRMLSFTSALCWFL